MFTRASGSDTARLIVPARIERYLSMDVGCRSTETTSISEQNSDETNWFRVVFGPLFIQGRTQWGIKGFLPPKLPKLDLTTEINFMMTMMMMMMQNMLLIGKCQCVVFDAQHCSLLHGYAIPA